MMNERGIFSSEKGVPPANAEGLPPVVLSQEDFSAFDLEIDDPKLLAAMDRAGIKFDTGDITVRLPDGDIRRMRTARDDFGTIAAPAPQDRIESN